MSSPEKAATREQLTALHALYARWEGHTLRSVADPRITRLAWGSEAIGREISSFRELTLSEARMLIDVLKGLIGQPTAERPNPWRPIHSRDRARAAGTAGRADENSRFVQLANADDFARIHQALDRLGWTREEYETWLSSKSSPLAAGSPIRTVAQANKVWWALKAMLRRSGRWYSDAGGHRDQQAWLSAQR